MELPSVQQEERGTKNTEEKGARSQGEVIALFHLLVYVVLYSFTRCVKQYVYVFYDFIITPFYIYM
jgi:hypothetical protein